MSKAAPTYDSAVRLLSRAAAMARNYAIGGALFGVIVLGGLGAIGHSSVPSNRPDVMLIAGVVAGILLGGFTGWRTGRERALKLRLDAHTALCQARIEVRCSTN